MLHVLEVHHLILLFWLSHRPWDESMDSVALSVKNLNKTVLMDVLLASSKTVGITY